MTTIEFQSHIKMLQADLFALAMKLSKNYTDAEDLVQEAITKAFKFKSRFEDGSNFKAWISTILYNNFVTEYRKRKRRRKTIVAQEDWLPVLMNKGTSVQAESSLLLEELFQIINQLDKELSVPFMMHYEGYAYKEIAEELAVPIGTIKSRIFYARKELRREITKKYGEYPLKKAA